MKDELQALQAAVDSYNAAPTKMIVEAIDMTHREAYPDQYNHELCGAYATTASGDTFTIYRVVGSRFGQLAMSQENQKLSFAVNQLTISWESDK